MQNKLKPILITVFLLLSIPCFAQKYHVCFGSYQNKAYADELVKKLLDGGVEAFSVETTNKEGKIIFRVVSKKASDSINVVKTYMDQLTQSEVIENLKISGLWCLKVDLPEEEISSPDTKPTTAPQSEKSVSQTASQKENITDNRKNYGNAKIVVEWTGLPYDLDAHLYYGKDHVYYGNKKEQDISLTIDDTYRYGPEVITIDKLYDDHPYQFYVHNYSDKNSDQNKQLSNSNVKVTLYINGEKRQTFTLEKEQSGTLWHVFDIRNGTDIILKNILSYDRP